jgi:hypothetical protein
MTELCKNKIWAEFDQQLQPVLGEKGCARFKQSWQEMPAHATVDLLNGQLGATQLSGEQGDRLFQAISTALIPKP